MFIYKDCLPILSLSPLFKGVRDQALDWMTAPPVHVLSYLVLGSEKDAKSSEVCTYVQKEMYHIARNFEGSNFYRFRGYLVRKSTLSPSNIA